MPDTPETPAPSARLLRSQAVAREIEATLERIERKLDKLDATIGRGFGGVRDEVGNFTTGLRAEVAAHKRVVWIGYGCHIVVAAVVLALLVWER